MLSKEPRSLRFVQDAFGNHVAEQVLDRLMRFWRTETGTYVLATALAVHVLNALWSIYIRRYLRLSLWELAQLSLGLSIPPLFILHVTSTTTQ
jgi:hypothetical protein